MINAGNFEWIDPNAKNGTISFSESGRCSIHYQHNNSFEDGSWVVDDVKTITIRFARQGDRTL